MEQTLKAWKVATDDLAWGVQHALHDTLTLVSEEKVRLTWGADEFKGVPCLINAVANLIAVDVNQVHPGTWFTNIVSHFDRIGQGLFSNKLTPFREVNPLMADILLRNFGTLKEQPNLEDVSDEDEYLKESTGSYIEPTDADMSDSLSRLLNGPNPVVCEDEIALTTYRETCEAFMTNGTPESS